MDLSFSMTEIWQLAVIKLLFLSFITLGIIFYWQKVKSWWLVILISLFSALAYGALAWQAQVPWWGLVGDELLVTSFLKKVASGFFFSDYFYTNLSPFYPPLYFWLVGGLGYIFKLNGVILSHLGVVLVLLSTPLLVYLWSRYQLGKNTSLLITLPALAYIVPDWQAVIFKPYEFFSGVLVVLWASFLLNDLVEKKLSRQKIIFYGVTGGLLFMTFYFWFFLVALAAGIFALLTKVDLKYYYGNLAVIGVVTFFIALPYLAPLLLTYLFFPTENWQPAWFLPEYLDLYLPFFNLSIFGLTSAFAAFCFIYFWKNHYIKALFSLLVACYVWQGISLFTIYFWDAPFLPYKPFLFFGSSILTLTAGFGLGKFIDEKIKRDNFSFALFAVAWLILASQLLGGVFIDQPQVRQKFVELKQPIRPELVQLASNLQQVKNISDWTILSSGTPEVSAFIPLDYYVSYNIHFAHPASNFSERYYFVNSLATATDAEDFYQRLKNSPLEKIDALLLLKGDGFYPINFWLDNYPLGGKAEEIRIPASLINEAYFVKIFEDKSFILLKIK